MKGLRQWLLSLFSTTVLWVNRKCLCTGRLCKSVWWTLLFNQRPGVLTARTVLSHSYTVKGAHSYKQELPNNCFVSAVITVCSSTARGSPWVEQACPRDGRSEEGRYGHFWLPGAGEGVRSCLSVSERGDIVRCMFMYLCAMCMWFHYTFHLGNNKPPHAPP